jgi:serine/threonine-protein kinase RsbW
MQHTATTERKNEMAASDVVDISIPSDQLFERIVRDGAGVVARWLGFSDDRLADMQLAVSEAVNNAIEHGNKNDARIRVGVRFVVRNDRLAIQVVDQGGGVADSLLTQGKPSIEAKVEREEELPRGLGIYLIEQLVDDVELQTSEQGHSFIMWFNLDEQHKEDADEHHD